MKHRIFLKYLSLAVIAAGSLQANAAPNNTSATEGVTVETGGDRNPASTGPRGASPAATGRRPPIAVTNWVMLLFLMLAAITPVRATEVSYNANGATGGTVPGAQTKTQDVPLTLATNSGNLARTGYTFVGWNTAADGTGDSYAAGGSYIRAPGQTNRHVVVASEAGFCIGWPANEGLLWVWGNEMLVGVTGARFAYRGDLYHPLDWSGVNEWTYFDAWLVRSLDGGETWAVEKPAALRGDIPLTNPAPLLGNIQSSNPDLIVRFRDQARYFHVSPDRGRTWGPYQEMPLFGFSKLAGRTDYLLSGPDDGLFFLTAQPEGGKSRVIAVETLDGGKNWALKAPLIGPNLTAGYNMMPSTVRVNAQRLVMATRFRGDLNSQWREGLQIHRSDDNGTTWSTLAFIDHGQPNCAGSLVRLNDGRLAVTYAYRGRGQMCVRLSTDDGASWSDEFVLRDKAGNWDIGYPRSAVRADGVLVTAYYWNDFPTKERYIAATFWTPPPTNRVDVAAPVTLYAQWGIGANAKLALHYKFDETSDITSLFWGGNFAWSSVGGNEGRLMNMGAGVWTPGKLDNCLSFDGANDYVKMETLGDQFPPLSVTNDCAISVWMNRSGVPSASVVLMDLATAGASGMKLVVRPGGNASLDATGGLVAEISDTRNICDGNWHHVAAVRAGKTFRLYVDGVLAGSNSNTSNTAPAYTRLTVAANISGAYCFGGKLDDVRVYSGAFSDTEIQTLYNSQAVGSYTVRYHANGAMSGAVPAAQTKTHNVALTLATNSGNLARPGYTFAGWNTAANGSGTDYAVSTSYNVNAPVTLYAKWTAAADDISGEWEMESEVNGRQMVSTLTFAPGAGGAITGKWGSTDLSNVKFDGRKLTFVRTMKFGDQEFSMNFAGIMKAGKVIAGTVSNDQGEFMIFGLRRHVDPASVGQWDLSYRYGDQDMTAKLAVSQNARGGLDAKWTSQRDESAVRNFKAAGGVLTFTRKIKFNNKEFETTFECHFAGDKLTGTAKSERGVIPVTGQRFGGALVGKWELTSTSDRGPRRNLLTIRGDLSGRYETFGEIPIQDPKLEGSEIPIQDLKLEGNQVSFKVVTTFQDQTRESTFKGTLDGKTLKGQITSQNGTREVTGKKIGGPWALFWE